MEPSKGAPQLGIQLPEVFRRAVRQIMLHFGPDELIGIELGGVRREPVNGQPWMPAPERRHIVALVNRPAIPEQFESLRIPKALSQPPTFPLSPCRAPRSRPRRAKSSARQGRCPSAALRKGGEPTRPVIEVLLADGSLMRDAGACLKGQEKVSTGQR